MSLARLNTSSIAATESSLGMDEFLPSLAAAMEVSERVALVAIVSLFIRGTVPILRLKMRVDLSASRIASTNFCLAKSASLTVTGTDEGLPVIVLVLTCERVSLLGFFGIAPKVTMFEVC